MTATNGTANGTHQQLLDEWGKTRLAALQVRQQHIELAKQQLKERAQEAAWNLGETWTSFYSDRIDRLRYDPFAFNVANAYDRRYGRFVPIFQTELELAILRAGSRVMANTNSFAQALVNGLTSYVIGTGLTYEPRTRRDRRTRESRDPSDYLADFCKDLWEDFQERNGWYGDGKPSYEEERFGRRVVDGENITALWADPDTGLCSMRCVEPEQVVQPPGMSQYNAAFGILTPPNDSQFHEAIWVFYGDTAVEGSWVPLFDTPEGHPSLEENPYQRILHCRYNVPRSVKRGCPEFVFDTQDSFAIASRLRQNLGKGAAVQASYAILREHEAMNSSDVADMATALADYQRTNPLTGNQENMKKAESAIVDAPMGMKFADPPSGKNGPAHVEIMNAIVLAAGGRWHALPWIMGGKQETGGMTSGQNAMIAETPFGLSVTRAQNAEKMANTRLFWQVVKFYCEIKGGIRGRSFEEVKKIVECHCEPKSIEFRDKDKQATTDLALMKAKIKPPQQIRSEMGIDSDAADEQFKEWEEEHGPIVPEPQPGMGGAPGANGQGPQKPGGGAQGEPGKNGRGPKPGMGGKEPEKEDDELRVAEGHDVSGEARDEGGKWTAGDAHKLTLEQFRAAHPVREDRDMKDYVRSYLSQYKKGKPGISVGMERPNGSGEVVFRGDNGKPLGVVAYAPGVATDLAVSEKARGQGVATKLLDWLEEHKGVKAVRGPFTAAGARIAHKRHVKAALRAGEPVPPEVLADYPDLHGKVKEDAGEDILWAQESWEDDTLALEPDRVQEDWNPSQGRGQPGNAGQFGSGGGAAPQTAQNRSGSTRKPNPQNPRLQDAKDFLSHLKGWASSKVNHPAKGTPALNVWQSMKADGVSKDKFIRLLKILRAHAVIDLEVKDGVVTHIRPGRNHGTDLASLMGKTVGQAREGVEEAWEVFEDAGPQGGHWVTIEGTHVFLNGAGVITKGPSNLHGKKLSQAGHEKATHHGKEPPTAEAAKQPESAEHEGASKKGGKKYGKSKAKVVPAKFSNPEYIQVAVKRVFGEAGSLEHVASAVGAPDDAEVKVTTTPAKGGENALKVSVSHPAFDAVRTIHPIPGDGAYVDNEEFWMKDAAQGAGLGSDVFGRQVENCREYGFTHIECHAAKDNPKNPSKPHNGYYTWPRLGYDAKLERGSFFKSEIELIGKAFPEAQTVQDIFKTKEGRDWWKKNGVDIPGMKFDLSEGSRSLAIFEDYMAERAARPSKATAKEGDEPRENPHVEEIELTQEEEEALERAERKREGNRAREAFDPSEPRDEGGRWAAVLAHHREKVARLRKELEEHDLAEPPEYDAPEGPEEPELLQSPEPPGEPIEPGEGPNKGDYDDPDDFNEAYRGWKEEKDQHDKDRAEYEQELVRHQEETERVAAANEGAAARHGEALKAHAKAETVAERKHQQSVDRWFRRREALEKRLDAEEEKFVKAGGSLAEFEAERDEPRRVAEDAEPVQEVFHPQEEVQEAWLEGVEGNWYTFHGKHVFVAGNGEFKTGPLKGRKIDSVPQHHPERQRFHADRAKHHRKLEATAKANRLLGAHTASAKHIRGHAQSEAYHAGMAAKHEKQATPPETVPGKPFTPSPFAKLSRQPTNAGAIKGTDRPKRAAAARGDAPAPRKVIDMGKRPAKDFLAEAEESIRRAGQHLAPGHPVHAGKDKEGREYVAGHKVSEPTIPPVKHEPNPPRTEKEFYERHYGKKARESAPDAAALFSEMQQFVAREDFDPWEPEFVQLSEAYSRLQRVVEEGPPPRRVVDLRGRK